VKLREALSGQEVQIECEVLSCEVVFKPRRQLQVTVDDGSDTCVLRFFNFFPSQQKSMAVGQRLRVRGPLRGGFGGLSMLHPVVKSAGSVLPQALTPVYPTTAGLVQPYLRKAIENALQHADVSETIAPAIALPKELRGMTLRQALEFLHHPTPDVALATLEDKSHPAWLRLKCEELLAQQLSQQRLRQERAQLRAPALPAVALPLHTQLIARLPFVLTAAQQRVCEEINADLVQQKPMHRLLQGDVGSGKTVVAALAALRAIDAGWQCALMAPTEILAAQHFVKLVAWLDPLGVQVAWLTGSQKKKERSAMLDKIAAGEAQLVVGTHAVIQDQVKFKNLALAVIDEQHRFGVEQRLALRGKMQTPGMEPHLLMMSATPIPRTLAMSYYADLDVSVIDELPPGRTPIVTRVVADARRAEVMARVQQQIEQGRQVYWVCPLIEESEALDLVNATQTHQDLQLALPGIQIGLLHSRMPAAEKKAVMDAFIAAELQLLVSTTVIEVGVDVPNASLMVIEHAERFGLSQLHQLRGRVGRGAAASACVLLYGVGESGRLSPTARERLRAMVETQDGFEIARRDLEIRGPGEFLGARQSGAAMLRFADLSTDVLLLHWAQHAAQVMLAQHPALAQRHIQRWLGERANYLKA
jgi:ATP-dependent DNA helicase RecG